MLQNLVYLSDEELDKIVASYGIVEELNQNKEYLEEYIDLAMKVSGSPICYLSKPMSVHR